MAKNLPTMLLNFDQLKAEVKSGDIDTVLVCLIDMQGRILGKRFHAHNFIHSAYRETHCCNYLLATDMQMTTIDGYATSSWQQGYGDYVMKPDLSSIRRINWLEATALVFCDIVDHHGQPVSHSPRALLQKQIKRLEAMGMQTLAATELEFFIFAHSYDEARKQAYRDLQPISAYNEDYHIFQSSKEEAMMQRVRNGLYAAGVPVENSKGEAEAGQQELNIRYAPALDCAEYHCLAKHACKEIAWQCGWSASFMAKYSHERIGSACHIHQSLWDAQGEQALFYDATQPHGMSELMRNYLAGLLSYTHDITYFLAPYINSYKRFCRGTFAPTNIVWALDNRTAGYRVCGANSKAVRVECRIGGADLNPYLALAAMLAAGIAGIEQQLQLEPEYQGDAYQARRAAVSSSLGVAANNMKKSKMLRAAFGAEVIEHYHYTACWQMQQYAQVVTDWELQQGFERG